MNKIIFVFLLAVFGYQAFATIYWIEIFIRDLYFDKRVKNLAYCRNEKV